MACGRACAVICAGFARAADGLQRRQDLCGCKDLRDSPVHVICSRLDCMATPMEARTLHRPPSQLGMAAGHAHPPSTQPSSELHSLCRGE